MEKKHSWLLDEIEIKDMASEIIWVFPCKQWLSLYIGDRVLKMQLKAYVKEIEQIGKRRFTNCILTGILPNEIIRRMTGRCIRFVH